VTVAPIRRRSRTEEQFEQLLAEVRAQGQRLDQVQADLQTLLRARATLGADRSRAKLVTALKNFFGPLGRLRVDGLLTIEEDDPHGEIAQALAELLDMNASPRSRATQLGILLRSMPELERVNGQVGAALYRLNLTDEVHEVHENGG
jgi:hypothetical protein